MHRHRHGHRDRPGRRATCAWSVARSYYEQLGFWLNPVAAVFTIGFSVVFLVLLAVHRREFPHLIPREHPHGPVLRARVRRLRRHVGVLQHVGDLVSWSGGRWVCSNGCASRPFPPGSCWRAIFVNALIISLVQVVVLFFIGRFGYHVALPHNVAALVVALIVGAFCFTSLGIAASTLIPNQEAAGPVVSIVFFVLLFLSGLWYPIKTGVGTGPVLVVLPRAPHDQRHLCTVPGPRSGVSAWSWDDILVMAIWAVGGIVVALRRWSWAPRRSEPAGGGGSPWPGGAEPSEISPRGRSGIAGAVTPNEPRSTVTDADVGRQGDGPGLVVDGAGIGAGDVVARRREARRAPGPTAGTLDGQGDATTARRRW